MNDLSMGIPGVGETHPGMHACALCSGPEHRDRMLVPYMQEGLRHGDQCVCLIDDLGPVSRRQRTHRPEDPYDSLRSAYLAVYPASHVYLPAGTLTTERTTSVVGANPASSTVDEIPLLRAAGEMSWGPHEPGATEFFLYESAVIQILAERPALFLCMYDLQRLDVGMLANVLRVHSTVLLDGAVLHNPHCLAPTDYAKPTPYVVPRYPLAKRRSGREGGGDQWLSLTRAEVRIAELVASGMTNRAIAEELVVSPHTVDAHLRHMYLKLGIHSRVELTVLALQHGPPAA